MATSCSTFWRGLQWQVVNAPFVISCFSKVVRVQQGRGYVDAYNEHASLRRTHRQVEVNLIERSVSGSSTLERVYSAQVSRFVLCLRREL